MENPEMNEVFVEYIRHAEDDLANVYRILETSPADAADAVRRDIATVIVQLYGLRHCQETGIGLGAALPHPIVMPSAVPGAIELSFRCGAD